MTGKNVTVNYSCPIVELIEFNMIEQKEPIKLIKMSTTYGASSRWNGNWSRKSNLWESVTSASILSHFYNLKAHEYFIPFEDYLKCFRSTTVHLENKRERKEI